MILRRQALLVPRAADVAVAAGCAQSDDLLTRIWDGVQQAQDKFTTGCGTMVETRTSNLMVKPMVLHGKFCAEGMTRFSLEYFAPNPHAHPLQYGLSQCNQRAMERPRYLEIGSGVRRAQSSFSRENSIEGPEEELHHHRAGEQPGVRDEVCPAHRGFSPRA